MSAVFDHAKLPASMLGCCQDVALRLPWVCRWLPGFICFSLNGRGVWEVARVFLSDWYTVWDCGWLPGSCYAVARVSLCGCYGVVGGCQGVYIWLVNGIVGGCQGVAMRLLRFLYVVAMGLWVVARVFMWLLVCCVWFLWVFLSDWYTVWECGWLPGSC